jgi:hypothetical protein
VGMKYNLTIKDKKMTKKEYIIKTATQLYFLEPPRRRRRFLKWELTNNWDVKEVFTMCILEATFMWSEFEKNKKHLEDKT